MQPYVPCTRSGMKRGPTPPIVARGSFVDEQVLLELLEEGHIAFAGPVVTQEEPLPEGSPLRPLPNVLAAPHASGLSESGPHQVFALFLENPAHHPGDGKLINRVDCSRKYRDLPYLHNCVSIDHTP